MASKKPKLPDAWLVINRFGRLASIPPEPTRAFIRLSRLLMGGDTVHRYAPVQPPKVCVWDYDGVLRARCDRQTRARVQKYCEACGGKVKTKEMR